MNSRTQLLVGPRNEAEAGSSLVQSAIVALSTADLHNADNRWCVTSAY
jgi:hypothetical protein